MSTRVDSKILARGLFFAFFIAIFSFGAQAQAQPNRCDITQSSGPGPIDLWPWSQAKTFTWSEIQGYWEAANFPGKIFRFKVTRETPQSKVLQVQIFDKQRCTVMDEIGIGRIDKNERNVLRVVFEASYMRLAWFKTTDLKMNANLCGPKVLAGEIIPLEADTSASTGNEKFMLKKLTGSIKQICTMGNSPQP